MEAQKRLVRSSDHLKEALNVVVSNDKDGKPVLVKKKKLVLLGVRLKGEKEFSLKRA